MACIYFDKGLNGIQKTDFAAMVGRICEISKHDKVKEKIRRMEAFGIVVKG